MGGTRQGCSCGVCVCVCVGGYTLSRAAQHRGLSHGDRLTATAAVFWVSQKKPKSLSLKVELRSHVHIPPPPPFPAAFGLCSSICPFYRYWVPHLTAWSKIQLGWMKPLDAPFDGSAAKFELYPSEQCPDVVRVTYNYQHTRKTTDNPNGFEEFLLLEQKAAVGVDSTQGRTGVTILHVDEDKADQNFHPNWAGSTLNTVRSVGGLAVWRFGGLAVGGWRLAVGGWWW